MSSDASTKAYEHEAERVKALFHHHKGRYGYRRITLALRNEGCHLNHPNLLQRDFHADAPNQKWVTDVTEFNLKGQKLYLSPVLDLYNSEIIAWQMATHQGMPLVDKMLDDALATLGPGDTPVLHSDQGWQYQMASYQTRLSSREVKQSMSRKGNCLDNAVVENFFGLLKSECWFNEKYEDTEQLKRAVDEYIHYYNHERLKVKLNGLSPVQYRTQAMSSAS